MALRLLSAPYLPKLSSPASSGRVHCSVSTQVSHTQRGRRSANYQPTVWTHDYLQSLLADESRQSHLAVKKPHSTYILSMRHISAMVKKKERPFSQFGLN
ncbi:hypothetical protein BT93_K1943 [Corymbia citriodora subsp. variegata]|nr:hypothetical protein BT93_K1943 [Corymbia citriodora subsp. variegata]